MIARLLVIAAVVGATSASVTQCYQCTSSQCNSLTSYSADLCSTSSSATSYYCYKTVYKAVCHA